MYNSFYTTTPEQYQIKCMIVQYKNDSGKTWAQISREANIPDTKMKQIRGGRNVSTLDTWERLKDYLKGIKEEISLKSFCKAGEKLDPNNPFDKEKIDERKLQFIYSYQDKFLMCGVLLRDFEYNPENKLFFIKDGVCRIAIDQICRAIQDKYYKTRLEKHIQFRV